MNGSKKLSDLGAVAKNASSLSEMYLAFEAEKKRKNDLAKKVMAAKGLTKEEKQEIYQILTSDEPPKVKKGRPTTNERDKAFAFDYLQAKYCEKKWTGIEGIAAKHKIDSNDITAIYKALKRGLDALETSLKNDETIIKEALPEIDESSERYANFKWFEAATKARLSLIKLHKLTKELKKNELELKQYQYNSLE